MELALPNVEQLKDAHMQVPLRILAADQQLIAEYGEKRRIPVAYEHIPPRLIQAILATEDKRFFEHDGIDVLGLLRAAAVYAVTHHKSQGGSTITMQVARNFFLTRHKTFSRKFNEILLAIKIDRAFSKQKILSLYINKIYLGSRAYGFQAAAQVYYGKKLSELNLAQLAMLAGLPKAPSSHNPLANPVAALKRRNHVLMRLVDAKEITLPEAQAAMKQAVTATYHGTDNQVHAPYVADMVRQQLLKQYGKRIYTDGFTVTTTIQPKKQQAANRSVTESLLAYTQRHGYRGPLTNLGQPSDGIISLWLVALKQFPMVSPLIPAAVITLDDKTASLLLRDGRYVTLTWPQVAWARPALRDGYVGKAPETMFDVLHVGDVIMVRQLANQQWQLSQKPLIQGALVALHPDSGAIVALVGGFNFSQSHYNRVTQASRQAGSAFKPFLYSAGLAKGLTLATIVNDAPIVIEDPTAEKLWRPHNDDHKFNGPTRLRQGLIKSTNLISIRILRRIGLNYARNYIRRFGYSDEQLPVGLSMALGSGTQTPLQLASGYATLANTGYSVKPYIIDKVTDKNQQVLLTKPKPEEEKQRVISPQVAYLMTSAMRTVIQEGTGRKARILNRHDLAGKTGTTNDQRDAWFAGFNQQIVTVCWAGLDNMKSIHEYGSQAALPMWIDFMHAALRGQAETPLPVPADMVMVRINKHSGEATDDTGKDSMFEVFRKQYAPKAIAHQKSADVSAQNSNDNAGATLF
ncbi:MAG: peptidase [marine bacterium B5-7]|nr:MAG: peptidase [marine bacterium B5-7]